MKRFHTIWVSFAVVGNIGVLWGAEISDIWRNIQKRALLLDLTYDLSLRNTVANMCKAYHKEVTHALEFSILSYRARRA